MMRFLAVVAVVAALGGLFLFGLLRGRPDRDIASNLLNKPIPDFEIPLFEPYHEQYGERFDLSDSAGRPLVINFWASWCAPCFQEAPEFEATWRKYQDRVLFVGIQTQDTNLQKGRAFVDQFNLSFPNGPDPDSSVSIDYGLFGVPETFFIRADGTLAEKYIGQISEALLIEKIEALLL